MKILIFLFTLIKYILIIFLVLILILFLLLFTPLKYRFKHKKNLTTESYADVKYLGGIVRYKCSYKDNIFIQSLKIFGYNILDRKKKQKNLEPEFSKPIDKTQNFEPDISKDNTIPEKQIFKNDNSSPTDDETKLNELRKKSEELEKEYIKLKTKEVSSSKKETKHKKFKTSELNQNKAILKKPKIKKEKEEKSQSSPLFTYIKNLSFDEKKEILALLKNYIKKVFSHLKLKDYKIYGEFGFDDPSKTGITFGMLSVVNGIIDEKLKLNPDFNEKKLNYEIRGVGKINLGILVFYTVQFALNKKIFTLIKLYLKG